MEEDNDISEVVDYQIQVQGLAVVRGRDGVVLVIPVETMNKLLAAAKEKGSDKVILFVKSGVVS